MPTIELPAGTIEYRITGPDDPAAPVVVFVHGLLVNNEIWTATADDLAARGIRSYAPTLPLGSHRIALHPDADLAPRDIATLLLDFLAALDLDAVTLVGNDTGGALCQFLVDLDSSRIARLVLTNCDAFDTFPPAPFGMIVAAGRRPGRLKLFMQSVRPRALRHSLLGFGGLARDLDPAMTRRWITPVLHDAGVRRDTAKFLQRVRPGDLLDVSTRLDRFDKPVLLLWGVADRFFKLRLAQRLATVFPKVTLVEIDGARTFVSLDEPARVADELAAFVATG